MYSIVLAAALTAAPATPSWGCHGCHGCHGCCGGWSCCGGCWGCCGGCWGCCGGCCGGGWGTSYVYPGACYGGCWGGWAYGCWGSCYGTGYGYGCWGYYAEVLNSAPATYVADAQPTLKADQARVALELPADATLYVDGKRLDVAAGRQQLVTPGLPAGKSYTYTLRAEATRDGQRFAQTREVTLRAGLSTEVRFDALQPVQAAVRSHVTVQLPDDAKLYVDGVLCTLKSDVREFDTPALDAGKTYYYTLKAEAVRNGKRVAETRRVAVQAGKQVNVYFNDLENVATAQR